MHWCVYPSPTHSLIQASKTESKTAKQYQQTPLTCIYIIITITFIIIIITNLV